jgi:hypothetical protein
LPKSKSKRLGVHSSDSLWSNASVQQ